MRTFPVMLNIAGRTCVVIGAGSVGLRKARALLEAGARLRLVDARAKEVSEMFPQAAPGQVELLRRPYRTGDLSGARLVFACTDDRALNARAAADARAAGILVNAADQPEDCDFYMPASVHDGDVVLAVGTGGSAPYLAAELKARLAEHLPPRVGDFAAALARLRADLKENVSHADLRRGVLRALSAPEAYNTFVEGGHEALAALAQRLLERARQGRS